MAVDDIKVDAVAENGRDSVSTHQIRSECGEQAS